MVIVAVIVDDEVCVDVVAVLVRVVVCDDVGVDVAVVV